MSEDPTIPTTPRSTPVNVLEDSVLIKRGAVQLLRLVQLATEIAAATDLDALLKTITEGLTRLLAATRTTIYTYDAKTDEIVTRVADRLEIREIRLPVGKGIAGHVARTRTLVHVPDVTSSPYFAPEFDKKTGFVTRSILAAPMLNLKRELVGVVEVLNKRAGKFIEEDEELLRLFASYAGVAVEAQVLEENLRRRERVAAIGALAGTIVHDIRNMAALVGGWVDLIQPGADMVSTTEVVSVIRGEADKMVDLTEEILEFARGGEARIHPQRVDVDAAVAELDPRRRPRVQGHRRQPRVQAGLGGDGEPRRPPAPARRPEPGPERAQGPPARRDARRPHEPRGRVRQDRVRGRRAGDPPEIRPKLFTPFTSAGSHGGTGLGLAICKSIVDAHGGKISVRDRAPHGTIFEIVLPA